MADYVLPLPLNMCNLMEEVLKKYELLNASWNTQTSSKILSPDRGNATKKTTSKVI